MVVLPPGTILQLMYLRERLRSLPAGVFVEIGPGAGEITRLLLELGWRGRAFELSASTVEHLQRRFATEVADGRLVIEHGSYFDAQGHGEADLVISCMVLEHFADADQAAFMAAAAHHLRPGGLMVGIVPGSPEHWGVEDDIAGHQRRYTRSSLRALTKASGWSVAHVAGLTYPVSNWLLPLSNLLVGKQERSKLRLPQSERTEQSGMRDVVFKTRFPLVLALLLNKVTMWPLHALQKLFAGSANALVLYFEALPPAASQPTQGERAWTPS